METSPKVTDADVMETLAAPWFKNDPWLEEPGAWLVSDEIEVTDDLPILWAMAAAFSAAGPAPCSAFNSWAVWRRMSCAWALKSSFKHHLLGTAGLPNTYFHKSATFHAHRDVRLTKECGKNILVYYKNCGLHKFNKDLQRNQVLGEPPTDYYGMQMNKGVIVVLKSDKISIFGRNGKLIPTFLYGLDYASDLLTTCTCNLVSV